MECLIRKRNIGRSKCTINVSFLREAITIPDAFEATEVEAADPAFWQALLLAANESNRGYLWPSFANVEPASEETIYAQTPIKDIKTRDGKYMWRALIDTDLCTHIAMRTHSGTSGRIIFRDIEGNLIGTENSNGNFTGFSLSLLNVEKLRLNDGSNPTFSPVYIVLKNNKQLDDLGWIIDGAFVDDLIPLSDVTLTIGAAHTTAAIAVSVATACDGLPVSGLLLADFILTTAAGAAQDILSATENPVVPGLYTLAKDADNFVDGFLDLRAPSLLTVKAYEAEVIAVDIT